jgi:hypothetical protein
LYVFANVSESFLFHYAMVNQYMLFIAAMPKRVGRLTEWKGEARMEISDAMERFNDDWVATSVRCDTLYGRAAHMLLVISAIRGPEIETPACVVGMLTSASNAGLNLAVKG